MLRALLCYSAAISAPNYRLTDIRAYDCLGLCRIDQTGWTDYETRHQALEQKLHPEHGPGGPPPGDPGTNFMNVPVLPVQDFTSFSDLK